VPFCTSCWLFSVVQAIMTTLLLKIIYVSSLKFYIHVTISFLYSYDYYRNIGIAIFKMGM